MAGVADTLGVHHTSESPLIETSGLSKVYEVGDEKVTPVSDVSLQVGYGEFAVIFGPSGAGKSTLLDMLMGLEPPDVGEVFIKGSSLYQFSEEERTMVRRKRIGFVPQDHYWVEYLSIIDNVALPLLLDGFSMRKARKKAYDILVQLGMNDRLKHRPNELSSGQQQRVSLARALVKDPWVIFADEPTAHLDTQSVHEVADLLMNINQGKNVTIVMVTHDMNFLKLSKKWFFMQDGRIHNIKDRHNPFKDIEEAVAYIEQHADESKS